MKIKLILWESLFMVISNDSINSWMRLVEWAIALSKHVRHRTRLAIIQLKRALVSEHLLWVKFGRWILKKMSCLKCRTRSFQATSCECTFEMPRIHAKSAQPNYRIWINYIWNWMEKEKEKPILVQRHTNTVTHRIHSNSLSKMCITLL